MEETGDDGEDVVRITTWGSVIRADELGQEGVFAED